MFGSSAWAQTFTQGDLKFTVTDADAKTVSVAKASNDITGEVVLPSTVTYGGVDYTVTTIVGFAETEEQFQTLLRFISEAKIDRAGCFAFSSEKHIMVLFYPFIG